MGSQVFVNGGFFAIRRELLPDVPNHLTHDSIVPCTLALKGYRTNYEPEAISHEIYDLDTREDWRRRSRTVLQALQSYWHVKAALNPLRNGYHALQIWSHRFLRWVMLPVLAVAFIANILLATYGTLYLALAIAQVTCYLLAAGGTLLDKFGRRPAMLYFPFYFLHIHAAAFRGVVWALVGRKMATWQPTSSLPRYREPL